LPWRIREYRANDLSDLRRIYAGAIRHLGRRAYSEEQVAVWSDFSSDAEAFREWIENAGVYVAVTEEGACMGFAGLEQDGHISSVYVSPCCMRKGVASQLLRRLLKEAQAKGLRSLHAEASAFSRPLFEKFGFSVVEKERMDLKGVGFDRYVVRANI
jgi:putative acetyltransferase